MGGLCVDRGGWKGNFKDLGQICESADVAGAGGRADHCAAVACSVRGGGRFFFHSGGRLTFLDDARIWTHSR